MSTEVAAPLAALQVAEKPKGMRKNGKFVQDYPLNPF